MLFCTAGFSLAGEESCCSLQTEAWTRVMLLWLSVLSRQCSTTAAELFRAANLVHKPFLSLGCLEHKATFSKGGTCHVWEIQMRDDYGCKLQLLHKAEAFTLCGCNEVCALRWPVGEVVKTEIRESFIIVLILPYPSVQKALPGQFNELLWPLHAFRSLADNMEAEKCLNLLKPSRCLEVEQILIQR